MADHPYCDDSLCTVTLWSDFDILSTYCPLNRVYFIASGRTMRQREIVGAVLGLGNEAGACESEHR